MRIDSQPPPIRNATERREVKGVSAVHAVKPIDPHAVHDVVLRKQYPPAHADYQQSEQKIYTEDRRIKVRRVEKHAVSIELRSGVDRRHLHVYIDEEA